MDTQERRERKKLARRNEIIDAAIQLFSEKDFHEVTVEGIAERVGLAKGTVYLYFENKDDLFFSVIQGRSEQLLDILRTAVSEEQNFTKSLHRFIYSHLSFFENNTSFFKIIHSEKSRMNMDSHYRLHKFGMKIYSTFLQILIDLVDMGQRQKVIRAIDRMEIAIILRGILDSYTFQRVFLRSSSSIEHDCKSIIDIFINGVKT